MQRFLAFNLDKAYLLALPFENKQCVIRKRKEKQVHLTRHYVIAVVNTEKSCFFSLHSMTQSFLNMF